MAVRHLTDDAQPDRSTVARRCFIAAHPKTNLDTIRAILAERGIEATASYERPWIGARPLDTVMALIEAADLIVGVLDAPSMDANLLIELGYAIARDKKIMVILPRNSRSVPSDLVSTLYVRANPTDVEAIAYNLDALLAAPAPQRRPYIPAKPETYPIGSQADGLLSRLSVALQTADARELEAIVVDAMRASGVRTVTSTSERSSPDSGFDLGIWSDDLESSVSNPLLIELKLRITSRRDMSIVRDQVASHARARSVDWALILYGEGPPHWDDDSEIESPVLVYRIGDLIERLRRESFALVISSLRDRAIRAG
jgi:hypothetical protein